MQSLRKLTVALLILAVAGCSSSPPTQPIPATTAPAIDTLAPVATDTPLPTETLEATPTLMEASPTTPVQLPTLSPAPTASLTPQPTQTLGPDDWKELPIIPHISERTVQIYQRGLELGNNPHAFSKIGDCGSTPAWFLGDFDRGEQFYRLGEYQSLARVIQEFRGSFDRTSLAARSGFNASSLFVPLWADRSQCLANETPLACEYRVHRPIIAFIMLGSNDVWHPDEFEPQIRRIIEESIDYGVIPILATKADNLEGDGHINDTIARLALEYDIPLWNFWRSVQDLPSKGLQEDQVHLTWGRNFFDDPQSMNKAWPIRNLTALQVLENFWQRISGQSN